MPRSLLKKIRAVAGLALLVLVSACSSMSSQSKDRKTFQVRMDWVKAGPKNFDLGYRRINRMTPIVFQKDDMDYLIQGNSIDGIVAYSRTSGREKWRLNVQNGVESSAVLADDHLFFGGNDGQFYAVDAATGKIFWTFPTRIENLAQPIVDKGSVYFLTGNGSFFSLDAMSGKQNWLYSRQDTMSLNVRGGSKPALHDGVLIVGFSDGSLVALQAKTGQVKWEKQLNNNKRFRDLDTDPMVDGEFVYALGFDDKLYCLRTSTGDLVWKSETGGYGGMLIVGNKLMYANSSSEFIAVDKSTGNRIWSRKLDDGIATTPTSYRGLVVYGESQGSLIFLDSGSGKYVESFDPGRGILSPPLVDEKDNHVYFISGESNVYALEIGFKYPKAFGYLH